MERRVSLDSSNGSDVNEDSPLLSQASSESDVASTTHGINSNKGFTLRRCMVLPLFVCYCLAGGLYMYEIPQYTQSRMIEKYKDRSHGVNMSLTDLNRFGKVLNKNNCFINKSDPSHATFDKIQADTASWTMYFSLASLIPSLFTNLLWSSYSDILGRRFPLLISCSGTTIRIGLMAVVIHFELDLIYVLFGAIIDGLCGSFTLLFAGLFSYVSDITHPGKERTIAIVAMELILGLSFTVSSFFSGFVITDNGYFYPLIVCFSINVVGIIIFVLLVPETKPRGCGQSHSRNVFKVLAESFKFYFHGSKIMRLKYILLLIGFLFLGMPAMSRSTMEMLYQLGRPFCWNSKNIGYFGAIKSVISAIMGMVGVYLFRRCLADDSIATLSILSNGVSYIVEGLATTDALLYSVPVLASLSNLPIPMIRSLMSCLTPADKQGAMFASIAFIEGMCSLIGSVSNTEVYSATLSVMNGFVFILMAILTFIGAIFLLLFMYVNRRYKMESATLIINSDFRETDSN